MASVTPPTNELQAKGIREQEKGQVKRERESSNQRRQKETGKHLHVAIHMYSTWCIN